MLSFILFLLSLSFIRLILFIIGMRILWKILKIYGIPAKVKRKFNKIYSIPKYKKIIDIIAIVLGIPAIIIGGCVIYVLCQIIWECWPAILVLWFLFSLPAPAIINIYRNY